MKSLVVASVLELVFGVLFRVAAFTVAFLVNRPVGILVTGLYLLTWIAGLIVDKELKKVETENIRKYLQKNTLTDDQ